MKSDRFPCGSGFLQNILNNTSSNAGAAVSGKQSDVDQRELQLASIKQEPANGIVVPQNDAVLRVRIAHSILPALRLKLHRDKSLLLIFVEVHESKLI